jgi:hypothetical protein
MLAAMAASALLLVILGSKLGFFLDDWTYILFRREFDADAFLGPANEHLVAGAVAIWKLLLSGFGLGSAVPYRVVSTAIFLLGNWFLFVWIRRRLGSWPALLACLPVLFLGAAFEDLFWFASITFLGSLTCGLGMLVALDRRDRTGDALACAWLIGTMSFSSLWVPFALGAALDIVLRRDERDWRRRAYVIVLPGVLYVLWWLGWGHEAETSLSLHNVGETPLFVLNSFGAAIAALIGLATPVEGIASPAGLDWGRPLAIALGGLALWRVYRLDRIPRSFWVVLAIGLSFWILGGFDVKPGRVAWASRYQLPGAVFVLLVATELLRGVPLGRRLLAPALVVIAAAVTSNGLFLHEAYKSYLSTTQLIRADLSALELSRGTVDANFYLDEEYADTGFVYIDAGSYFAAIDEFGSPAYTLDELAASPEPARFAADKVLLNALRVAVEPVPRGAVPAAGCVAVSAGSPAVRVPVGGAYLVAGDRPVTDLKMRRFSTGPGFPVDFQTGVAPGSAVAIRIPVDAAPTPWKLKLEGGAAKVCPVAAG